MNKIISLFFIFTIGLFFLIFIEILIEIYATPGCIKIFEKKNLGKNNYSNRKFLRKKTDASYCHTLGEKGILIKTEQVEQKFD